MDQATAGGVTGDAGVQHDVREELKWEPNVDEENISASVKDGIVTLTGHVPSYAQKLAAELAVMRVYGVKAVANAIGVRPPTEERPQSA